MYYTLTWIENLRCIAHLKQNSFEAKWKQYLCLIEGGVREPTGRDYVAPLLFFYVDRQVYEQQCIDFLVWHQWWQISLNIWETF